jgi:hypothetical protein
MSTNIVSTENKLNISTSSVPATNNHLLKKTSLKKKQEIKNILQKFNITTTKSSKPSDTDNQPTTIVVKKEQSQNTSTNLASADIATNKQVIAQPTESQKAAPNSNSGTGAIETKPKIATLKAPSTPKLIKKQNAILDSINNLITQPLQDPGNKPASSTIPVNNSKSAPESAPVKVIKVNDEKGHLKDSIKTTSAVQPQQIITNKPSTEVKTYNINQIPQVQAKSPPLSPHPTRAASKFIPILPPATTSRTPSPPPQPVNRNISINMPLVQQPCRTPSPPPQPVNRNISINMPLVQQPCRTPSPPQTRNISIGTPVQQPKTKSLSANSKPQITASIKPQMPKSASANTMQQSTSQNTNPNISKLLEHHQKLEAQKLAILNRLKDQKQKLQQINDRRQEIAIMNHIKKSNHELAYLKTKLKEMEQPISTTTLQPPQNITSDNIVNNDSTASINIPPTPKPIKQLEKQKQPDYKYNPVSKLPLVLKVDNMQSIPESFQIHSVIPVFQITNYKTQPNITTSEEEKWQQLESTYGFKKDFGTHITNWLFENMCNSADIEFTVNFKQKRIPTEQKKLFNVDDDFYCHANLSNRS